jgi:hypothetical protein
MLINCSNKATVQIGDLVVEVLEAQIEPLPTTSLVKYNDGSIPIQILEPPENEAYFSIHLTDPTDVPTGRFPEVAILSWAEGDVEIVLFLKSIVLSEGPFGFIVECVGPIKEVRPKKNIGPITLLSILRQIQKVIGSNYTEEELQALMKQAYEKLGIEYWEFGKARPHNHED